MAAMRVSVGRLTVGSKADRKIIEPGSRFDPAEAGISDDDLKRMEDKGTVRKLRDQTARAPAAAGPTRATVEPAAAPVTEGRSGPVSDATSDKPNDMDAETDAGSEASSASARRRRAASSGDDDL